MDFILRYKMKKDTHLKKEVYIKFEDKDIYFYNVEDPEKKLELQYRNNDFLYRKGIFNRLVLVIDGTIKRYYFHISKNDKSPDYDRFYNDLQKNYIEKIKFWTWKTIGTIFVSLYIGIIWLFMLMNVFLKI
ncbi:hypothetical protein NK213_05240 [Sebaldella sp. S0638]|nr:hypothetical protein [Sebaldella sp. S0638]